MLTVTCCRSKVREVRDVMFLLLFIHFSQKRLDSSRLFEIQSKRKNALPSALFSLMLNPFVAQW